ncbi:MAG TPA: DUF6152 family protein [Vicinamibacterales bacterium]|jgi:Family of unknown function (DUF6152)|nr:DUF6152 family protein [Vicinamibacterales bacterium]
MKAFARSMAVAVAGLLGAAASASAHHAVQAVFDVNKPITVSGSITKVEWINPHSYISLDAKDEKGTVQHWVFELAGPGALRQAGLSREDRGGLKPGDMVKIEGIAAKDGTTTGFLNKLYFPDGRVFVLANKDPYAR